MEYQDQPNLLQSQEWADFNKKLGKKVFEQSGDVWQYVAILESGHGKAGKLFKRLYTPYGPFAKDAKTLNIALNNLEQLAKQNKVDYIRIDPTININNPNLITNIGYIKTQRPSQPEQTLVIDLSRPLDKILLDMSKTNQYLWRKTAQNNLTFKTFYTADMLNEFNKMVAKTQARNNAIFHEQKYYQTLLNTLGSSKKQACVVYAYLYNKPVAGAIFVDDINTKTRYYMYAGAYTEARKVSAASPLLVYAIEQAHKNGFLFFDMFGVSPINQPNHKWAGFSKFKRSFGGIEIIYNGTYEKPLSKKYHLLQASRKIAKKLSIT